MATAKSEVFAAWRAGKVLHIMEQLETTGVYFFVGSTITGASDTVGYGSSPLKPYATIDYAIGQCTAEQNDVIIAMENHAETITAAAGIVFDIQGVTLAGVGVGSDRPTITFNGAGVDTAVDMDIDAANVTIKNVKFINTEDGALAPIDVNAGYFTLDNCELIDDGTDVTVDWIVGDGNADAMVVKNCVHRGTDTAGADSFISMGAASHYRILNNLSNGNFAAANIEMTAASVDCQIEGNRLENLNAVDVCIEGFAAATGWVSFNHMMIITDAQVTWINTPGALALFENYGVNDDGETGLLAGTPSA